MFQEVNLLADIGGQLGLWIGVSVLTCCEFLELLWLLGKNAMNRIATKKGNRVVSLSRDLNTNSMTQGHVAEARGGVGGLNRDMQIAVCPTT